jgi:CPA2 family monovalent cation:H+ antiporter-2
MLHHPLIGTLVVGIVLAFVLGAIANRLRVSPLLGYLLAGVVVGPYTPGFVADPSLALELAEIGVILLMFGVGLHFSLKDLLAVRAIAIPGALLQIVLVTPLGMAVAWALGWDVGAGIVFGIGLSIASTVVVLRALGERHLLDTTRGRIAVGWLVVEDLVTILALLMLPPLAGVLKGDGGTASFGEITVAIGITVAKVTVFIALMLLVGRRVIPWVLHTMAHTGSRELFRLSVLAVALGVAYFAAELFDVSFALGAFFAGMVMSESQLSQEAAEQTLPLRDAFAVLFFVSVGMLFDPEIVITAPWALLAVLAIIVVGKSSVTFLLVRALRHPPETAFTVAAGRAQIGEFSFILGAVAIGLGVVPELGRDLIVAGAMASILVNPLVFSLADRLRAHLMPPPPLAEGKAVELTPTTLTGHAVVVGYGRVGSVIVEAIRARTEPVLVIEEAEPIVERLRAEGIEVLPGQYPPDELLTAAKIAEAKLLFVAIPNSFEAGQFVEGARAANARITIVARAHSDDEVEYLSKLGADATIMGEREIAQAMIARAFG